MACYGPQTLQITADGILFMEFFLWCRMKNWSHVSRVTIYRNISKNFSHVCPKTLARRSGRNTKAIAKLIIIIAKTTKFIVYLPCHKSMQAIAYKVYKLTQTPYANKHEL